MIGVTKQLPLDRSSQKALMAARAAVFDSEVSALAEQVYTGQMTIGGWEETMRSLIRGIHSSQAAIAVGGWENMSKSDWGKLGAGVKKQYKYLHDFAGYIADNQDTIALGSIQARARMYGEAAKGAAYVASTPIEIIQQLPWMPKDGSTDCLTNCKCIWLLSVVKKSRSSQTVRAEWRMTPAEHCDTCIERSGHVEMFTVPKSVNVPQMIGGL